MAPVLSLLKDWLSHSLVEYNQLMQAIYYNFLQLH